MFGKKKSERAKRDHSGKNLAQYGLFDIPTDMSFTGNDGSFDDGGDSDLESELIALSGGGGMKPKPSQKRTALPTANLDAMISASLKDIPSDEDLSGDDDDPELLNELGEITGEELPVQESVRDAPLTNMGTLLGERLKMYEAAEANAKASGETSRARRFGRGIKTLKDLMKQANAGKLINDDDIPPEVSVNVKKPVDPSVSLPSRPAPAPPGLTNDSAAVPSPNETPTIDNNEEIQELLKTLNFRKNKYKEAALMAKKAGDMETAVSYVKVVKQFEAVEAAVQNGQPLDLSGMPGLPPPYQPKMEENTVEKHNDPGNETASDAVEEGLITAGSVAEALDQRLAVYKKQEDAAKEQGNSSKARRMGRIVKQFEQAIKLNNAGKPIPFDELPIPPGYAPIPGAPVPEESKPEEVKPAPAPAPILEPNAAKVAAKPTPPPRSSVSRISGNHAPTTRAQKQVQLLLARQKEFKIAALNAKKKGEMDQAKEFLKTAKGFDPLIEASQGGLPVDITTLPVPPSARSQLDNEYELVMAEECTEDDTGTMDVLSRLEAQLTKQLKMCLTTRDHNKAIGDVAGTNRFEQLALSVTKDLDVVRIKKRTPCTEMPKFHYEPKKFSIVKSFTELNDNDLELFISRGINYNCSNPKEIDTYVRFEFPYPQEAPVKDKTSTVKDTNNPEYNATFILAIDRSSKPCLRMFKRHAIKLEVYSKGGLFRADTLLGSVSLKLQPLETQCQIHDSFDLMDGRKKAGGKLEIRVRVRNPLISKQIEQISEKWLILD